MRGYFARVRQALNPDGVFFLDAFGGPDASDLTKEKTKLDGFTYVWEQAEFEPVTSRILCHIHFKFPDGSKIKRAFTYDWRLWTLPELRELLTEAGFRRSACIGKETTATAAATASSRSTRRARPTLPGSRTSSPRSEHWLRRIAAASLFAGRRSSHWSALILAYNRPGSPLRTKGSHG